MLQLESHESLQQHVQVLISLTHTAPLCPSYITGIPSLREVAETSSNLMPKPHGSVTPRHREPLFLRVPAKTFLKGPAQTAGLCDLTRLSLWPGAGTATTLSKDEKELGWGNRNRAP